MNRPIGSLKACIFGCFPNSNRYSSNMTLTRLVSEISGEVKYCQPVEHNAPTRINHRFSFIRYTSYLLRTLRQLAKITPAYIKSKNVDYVFIGYPAYIDILVVMSLRLLRRNPKIVTNAFLGLHDTIVNDRKLISRNSVFSKIIRCIESATLSNSDLIIIDTIEQAAMLSETYNIDIHRFLPLPVGIDENIWAHAPYKPDSNRLNVCMWLTFIPLHGIKVVADAARILENSDAKIIITIIGDGQTADDFHNYLKQTGQPTNLYWVRNILPQEEIYHYASNSDCILGIFSETDKAQRVVPYKIYQAMAVGRSFITMDSPAMRNILDPELHEHTLIPSQNPEALAQRLQQFSKNRDLLAYLSDKARLSFEDRASSAMQRKLLTQKLEKLYC